MMGILTEDITRLVGEIGNLRLERGALMQELGRGAKELEETVSALRFRFRNDHQKMARKTKDERLNFVLGLNKTVASMLGGFASDLEGAYQVWQGISPMDHKAKTKKKK